MLKTFKVGHYTDSKNGTGCSVILPPAKVVCSAYAMGASPGTREYALLQPDKKIESISALVLTGGSAFGLNAASGVVEELESQNIGYQTNFGIVPIVPSAVIFDLNIGNGAIRPGVQEGKLALNNARFDNYQSGNIGAGTGATVGKWSGLDNAMKGGLGVAQIEHGTLKACAVLVVNSVGDVIDNNGRILAGAQINGKFVAENDHKKRWGEPVLGLVENTVLCAVLTNAVLSKQQANYLAGRAHFGISRRIIPSHTSYDGDVSFVLASGEVETTIDILSAITIEAVEQAVINAVKNAESVFGIPSYKTIS
ncbi:MAG: peptidase S58 family protein [Calditrichaeota bacterium]|nr:MAG: peptidase S58 family protein [Calditrichota bacterium]MBL1204927.1 peptidase S58 family protein [Calditrichota bacterium]NOG44756.1 P1 family peptidase [Calditrichota bacterium]